MNVINSDLIDYIESTDDQCEAELKTLIEIIEEQKILVNKNIR